MTPKRVEVCKMIEWDTAFFGFRIARVSGDLLSHEQARRIDAWCHQNRVRCLYFLARADDANTTRLAEKSGFQLVDIRMTLEYRDWDAMRSNRVQQNSAAVKRFSVPKDVPSLQSIARESYYDTRFYFDTNFPRHLCDSLYETWIKKSCEGYADTVLVAELAGTPVGYISCHLEAPHTGRIGLVGVSSQARGQGIGQALIFSALEWFIAQEIQEVLVVTQGRNLVAQRLYQRCGFLTHAVQLWYHKWYASLGED